MKKDFRLYDGSDMDQEKKKEKIMRICLIMSMAAINLVYLHFAYEPKDIVRLIVFDLTILGIYLTNKK